MSLLSQRRPLRKGRIIFRLFADMGLSFSIFNRSFPISNSASISDPKAFAREDNWLLSFLLVGENVWEDIVKLCVLRDFHLLSLDIRQQAPR